MATRPRFNALLSQFKDSDFDNYAEPSTELRELLREPVVAWHRIHDIPAEVMRRRPPLPTGGADSMADMNGSEAQAWMQWQREASPYFRRYPRLEEERETTEAVIHFHRSGRNIFAISSELQLLLDHTSVEAVRWENITLPYPTLYLHFGEANKIELPRSYYQHQFEDVEWPDILQPGRYWLDGAFVHSWEDALEITLAFRGPGDEFEQRVPQYRDFRFPSVRFTVDFKQSLTKGLGVACAQAAVVFHSLWDAKRETQEVEYGSMREVLRQDNFEYDSEREEFKLFAGSLTLILNSLCYLGIADKAVRTATSSREVDVLLQQLRQAKNKQRRQPVQQRLAKLSYSTIHFCGEEVRPVTEEIGPGEVAPHWRRGHWRQQPIGPGRSATQLMWIRPVIVRKDKGMPTQGHLYQVNDTEPTVQN
jgi:hypothetical protein